MRGVVAALVVALVGLLMSLSFWYPASTSLDRPQDVASATYWILTQLDCDTPYDNGANCTDELNNVNESPRLVKISEGDGIITVTEAVSGANGLAPFTYSVRFNNQGVLLNGKEVTR